MRKNNESQEIDKNIVFVNKPINCTEKEILGYSAQAVLINSAIDDGANIIGIIADYGTGKSTLTELLCLENAKHNHKVIKINLWDTLSTDTYNGIESVSGISISALERSFVFQLANGASKNRWLSKYVAKRMSKNYGFLSFNPLNLRKFIVVLIVSLLVFAVPIAVREVFLNLPVLLDLLFSIASPWVAGAIALFGLIKTNVVFSRWDSQGKNSPEKSDMFSLFCEVVEELCDLEEINNGKKLMIVIEDLDRIKDKNIVLSFLKEIYKYNNLLHEKYKSEIVTIVSVMPEEILELKGDVDDFGSNIYSKIFDYSINLQSIHNDDYSQVAFDLLLDKQEIITQKTGIAFNNSLPYQFSWIIKGEHLTLRDIKNRLNNCFSIYERLKLRDDGSKKLEISIEKCVAVSYLQNNYPKEILELCKEEEIFSEIINRSGFRKKSKARGLGYKVVGEFKDELSAITKNFAFSENSQFMNDIINLLEAEIITDDFKMYFYTYPKKGLILSAEETIMRKMLNRDQIEFNQEEKEIIDKLSQNSIELVVSWCQELVDQKLGLPLTVLYNKMLFKLCCERMFDDTVTKIINELGWEPQQLDTSEKHLEFIKTSEPDDYIFLMEDISKELYTGFTKYDDSKIITGRKSIIRALGDDIKLFKTIYFSEQMPIIAPEEIELIKNKEILLVMINKDLIAEENSNYIAASLISEYDSKYNDNVVEILSKCLDADSFTAELCLEFMSTNKFHNQKFFSKIISKGINENCKIVAYLNSTNLDMLDDICLDIVNSHKIFGDFTREV